jgi:hypothetical protein
MAFLQIQHSFSTKTQNQQNSTKRAHVTSNLPGSQILHYVRFRYPIKASAQSECLKRVLKASSQSEFLKQVLKASAQSECSKRVFKANAQSECSKQVLKASAQSEFSK